MEESSDYSNRYDAIIGGAGIGGLTCGALLAKEGLKVLVIERREKPGGYALSFENKGYHFQFPHLMSGCGPRGNVSKILEYLEINLDMISVDPYHRYIFPDHDISVPSNLDEFKSVLKDEFQPQTTNLNSFFDYIDKIHRKNMANIRMKSESTSSTSKMFLNSVLSPFRSFQTLGNSATLKLLTRFFTDEKLISILAAPWPRFGSPPWELSSQSFVNFIMNHSKGAYIPAGGYQALSDSLEKSIRQSGGEILCSHEIIKVDVSRERIAEVITKPENRFSTGFFISDIDTKHTMNELISVEDEPVKLISRVQKQTVSMSGFVVFLGISKTLTTEEFDFGTAFVHPSYNHKEMYELLIDNQDYPESNRIPWSLSIPSLFDPSYAPVGKTALSITIPASPYSFKDNWGAASAKTRNEIVERYAEIAVGAAAPYFPSLISDVEAYEAVSPIDFEQRVMSTHGCWYDIAPEPQQTYFNRIGPGTPIQGIYTTGSKSFPGGGIHSSMLGGLLAANSVLRVQLID